MPSSQLTKLCEQIEKQNTDHFGKFYMYVSLLNTLTVRNKTFIDGLPKYSKKLAFWKNNTLNIGEIPVEFYQQLNPYFREFVNLQPHWSNTLYNIAMAYVRNGKITDLTYIVDQMLSHLSAIHGPQSHNQKIYDYIKFDEKKASIVQFIGDISACNQQLLSIVDNGCNTALSLLAVTTGLVIILASVFSLVPSLLGLGLMIGGAYSAFTFVSEIIDQVPQLEEQAVQIMTKMKQLPEDKSLFGDKNHYAFFSSIFMPLPYTAITIGEQLVFDEANQEKWLKARSKLIILSNMFTPA